MRIGIDLLAAQSPQNGRRGIGRYGRHLATALLKHAARDGDQYVLYRRPSLIDPEIEGGESAEWRDLSGPGRVEAAAVDRLARENPDGLDALFVLSPFESWDSYLTPASPPAGPGRPVLAAVVHDVIPFLFPPEHAPLHPDLRRMPHGARSLVRYDALLANSDSSRNDAIQYLSLDPDRITTIGAAADEALFGPEIVPDRDALARLGIEGPFVFCVGGMDTRKNFHGLVDAFALLPEPMRRSHQLVVTFSLWWDAKEQGFRYARERGVEDALVMTGEVPDATLRQLYGQCAAFVFPSKYEGFGLPILEAMRCGAPVVVADNSSQPEVVGDAGLLADASDPRAIADQLARILGDPGFATSLRAKSRAQATRFSWSLVAEKARAAIAGAVARRDETPRPRKRLSKVKPWLAMVSPLPPRPSGISDYAVKLIEEFRREYRIDLFHDGLYTPLPALADPDLNAADVRILPRLAALRDYRAIVYQMGNSRFHQFMYQTMLDTPGVVTLHDYCLAGFHQGYNARKGAHPDHFVQELEHGHPGNYDEVVALFGDKTIRPDDVTRACAERKLWVNRRVFETAETVIVHSPWCLERTREQGEDLAEKTVIVPMGTTPETISAGRRAEIRGRFGLPDEALVVASFGFIHPDKMSPEALAAFASVARDDPNALFLFVGQDADGGDVRREADRLGLAGRTRFLGRRPDADFHDLAAITDIGINLRRPPTNGETSAALMDLLRRGVPTIVTDVATFADYPDAVVAKVRCPDIGNEGLTRQLRSLAFDPARREALGRAALDHVRRDHQWPDVAARYIEVIERAAERRSRGHQSSRLVRGAS